VPLVVLSSGLPASIAVYLQRGVPAVVAPSGTPAALVWLARRA